MPTAQPAMASDPGRQVSRCPTPKGCGTRDSRLSHAPRDSGTVRDSWDSWDSVPILKSPEIESATRAAQHFSHKPQGIRSGLRESWGRP